ncbi:MAG TPA: phage tail sheath subtilisin-like domain-containing protein [Roseomonas sp.]|nr:phage tail sheath subtilisin-like domain-containing protein [Roseomonas sp.]
MIDFSHYDITNRVPGVYAEVDPSGANTGSAILRALIIGQGETGKVSAAQAGVPVIYSGQADAEALYGARSPLAMMTKVYRLADPFGELWHLPLADAAGGAAATGTLALTGTAAEAGTLGVYIGGVRVPVQVGPGDTAAVVATNLAAACSAAILPATAAATDGSVTFTATGKGAWGNEIPIAVNFGGILAGETMPTGLTATVTAMAGGTGVPALAAALANLGETTFDFIICPYTDTTSLDALKTFLDDVSGRWSWQQMLYGGFFTAFRGTLGERITYGKARNDPHGSSIGFQGSPSPAWLWAASYGGVCAASLRVDPALPLQNIALPGIIAPPIAERDDPSERNSLLYAGNSTYKVGADGTVYLDRAVTFYQKNAAGVADNAYLDVETPYTLQYLIRDLRTHLATVYERKKLVADGTTIEGGSNMVTSQTVLASAIARYRTYCEVLGLAQNFEAFRIGARAENAGKGVVKLLAPFDVANQLRVIAIKVNFLKS